MTTYGYFLSSEELGPRDLVATAQFAESAGFDRVWVSDHYHPWTTAQGESAFVWSTLAAIAATTNLRMTSAVTCPTYRIHPAVLAQATATTAALAPGRFAFGVGSGERLNEHILGDPWPSAQIRLERMAEAIELIRKLWTGETVTYRGTHFAVDSARIFSLPEEPPPVLVSGFGPKATDLAADIGDGWISVHAEGELLQRYRDKGGTGVTQGGLKICWAESADDAAKTAYERWGFQSVGGPASQELPTWDHFESLVEASSPEKMADEMACGPDPDRAAEAIRAYVDAGFDEVYIAQMGPDQRGGIKFLTEQVLPRV